MRDDARYELPSRYEPSLLLLGKDQRLESFEYRSSISISLAYLIGAIPFLSVS
jgi:hypothetical protein